MVPSIRWNVQPWRLIFRLSGLLKEELPTAVEYSIDDGLVLGQLWGLNPNLAAA
jgi:hypothetical protein